MTRFEERVGEGENSDLTFNLCWLFVGSKIISTPTQQPASLFSVWTTSAASTSTQDTTTSKIKPV